MKYVSIFLIGIFFVGCDAFNNENTIPDGVYGIWEWTGAAGGWGGGINVDSVDYKMTLIMQNNEAKWYRDNKMKARFQVERYRKNWRNGSFHIEKVEGMGCSYIGVFEKAKQSLELIPSNCLDAPSHYFKKISD
jgi:hypothetical protein